MRNWVTAGLVILGGLSIVMFQGINSDKDILSFSINGAEANINQSTGEMDVIVPTGTNLTSLAPIFSATGPAVTVYGLRQYSGISTHNFESNVPYISFASDGSTKSYFAHVTTGSHPSESMSYFQFFDVDSGTNGGISEGIITGSNIAVTVPFNTNLNSLPAYFNYIGTAVKIGSTKQISNITTNNYTSPVSYGVYANDGSSNNYSITVTKAGATAKAITSFNLITGYGIYPGTINGTNIHVGVPTDVVTSHLIAQYTSTGSLVKVGSAVESSGLSVNNFISPVTYIVTSGDGLTTQNYIVTVDNYYSFLDVHNLAETMFDNESYNVSFNVTNRESATITGITSSVTMPSPIEWTQTGNTCTGSLAVSATCALSGTFNIPKSYGAAVVKFSLLDGSSVVHASYDKIITAAPQITELQPGIESPTIYAAYRFTNAGSHRLYASANVNDKSICFDSNNIGTIESYTNAWNTCAQEMTRGHDTLYIPAFPGVGGKVLLSVDTKIPDGPSPSVTATNPSDTYYTRWQQVEYGGGLNQLSQPALFNLNPTNVNFIGFATNVSTVISGVVGPYNNNSYALQGIMYGRNIKTQPVFSAIESSLDNVPNGIANSWQNLAQLNAAQTNVLRILSPSQVFPFMGTPSSQFYFDGSLYTQYINNLWDYYKDTGGNHFLYSNDDPIASLVIPGEHCTLKCQVTAVDDKMHCIQFSGTCPINVSTGSLDGAYNFGVGNSSESGFTKFAALDFVSAAGTPSATTFGTDGTYRSVTGQNIVAGQSVGFLPFCSNVNFVFGNPQFVANIALYYTPQYNCLTNYSSYTSSVIDQYSYQSQLYFWYYNYGYSDTLGQSGAVYSFNNESYPFTIDTNYQ